MTYFVLEGKIIKNREKLPSSTISLVWAINRLFSCSLDRGGLRRSIAGWRPLEWAGDGRTWGWKLDVLHILLFVNTYLSMERGRCTFRGAACWVSLWYRLTLLWPQFYENSWDLVFCFHGILTQINGSYEYAYLSWVNWREFMLCSAALLDGFISNGNKEIPKFNFQLNLKACTGAGKDSSKEFTDSQNLGIIYKLCIYDFICLLLKSGVA